MGPDRGAESNFGRVAMSLAALGVAALSFLPQPAQAAAEGSLEPVVEAMDDYSDVSSSLPDNCLRPIEDHLFAIDERNRVNRRANPFLKFFGESIGSRVLKLVEEDFVVQEECAGVSQGKIKATVQAYEGYAQARDKANQASPFGEYSPFIIKSLFPAAIFGTGYFLGRKSIKK